MLFEDIFLETVAYLSGGGGGCWGGPFPTLIRLTTTGGSPAEASIC